MYNIEQHIGVLRSARLSKGLSQAELGSRVGLPQSHISKIEKGGTDLRLSSLVEIARALDLELKLVPRSALPAVNSLVKASVPGESDATSRAVDQIHRAQELVDRAIEAEPRSGPLKQYQETLSILERQKFDLPRFNQLTKALEPLHRLQRRIDEINAPVRRLLDSVNASRRLRESRTSLENLRESMEKVPVAPLALPAYRLDGNDDE